MQHQSVWQWRKTEWRPSLDSAHNEHSRQSDAKKIFVLGFVMMLFKKRACFVNYVFTWASFGGTEGHL